ncbi:MAG: tripartite tricarboxylate transporter TctB family protein [Octadecabacter sp.]
MDLLDVLTLGSLVVLSVVAFYMARDFGDGTPSGGNVFPQLISGVVFLTAGASLVMRSREDTFVETGQNDDGKKLWNPLIIAALTFGFLVLLPIIGYPLLAPLWLCAIMWVFGMRSLLVLGLVAIGLSALAWILLSRLAFAPPPAGLLERFL